MSFNAVRHVKVSYKMIMGLYITCRINIVIIQVTPFGHTRVIAHSPIKSRILISKGSIEAIVQKVGFWSRNRDP